MGENRPRPQLKDTLINNQTLALVAFLAIGTVLALNSPLMTPTEKQNYLKGQAGDSETGQVALPIATDWFLVSKPPPNTTTQAPPVTTPTPNKDNPTPTPSKPSTGTPDTKSPYKTTTPEYNENSQRPLYKETLNDSWGPYFNQRDINWYHQALGYTNYADSMGSSGCLVADIAMMWSHVTGKIHTPSEVNRHKEWFVKGTLAIATPLPTLSGHKPIEFDNTNFDFLHQEAQKGYSFILELKWQTPQGQNVYHYVVARGLDKNGHFLINDSWYGGNIAVPYGMHWGNENFTGRAWAYK